MVLQEEHLKEEVIRWRRHLHQHPELSFQEKETSQFVYDTLCSFSGLEVSRPTETSVMAKLKGAQSGKTLAIRADMDALPIQEENSFDFVSQNDGVMHACGHDGHTAMLLGAAKILTERKDEISGEVRFLFQHAEETPPGGAQEMVKAGVMEGVDFVVGVHLQSLMEFGKIGLKSGPLQAAPDTFNISIFGKGGHAAEPENNVDPISIGSQVVTNLQHVVARYSNPADPLVLSVTKFHGGDANNVIPSNVELGGTVRRYSEQLGEEVPNWMHRLLQGITSAHDADYHLDYNYSYKPVINDERVTELVRHALEESFEPGVVQETSSVMAGEDFSAFQQEAPGCFIHIGAGNPQKGIAYPHHHPKFTFDENILPIGVKTHVSLALKLLS